MYYHQISVLTILLVVLTLGIVYVNTNVGLTLGATDTATATVSATIPFCPQIIVTPEKRIPPSNNNSIEITVDIRPKNGSNLYSNTIIANDQGKAPLCPLPSTIIPGNYDVLVKGLSHLRRIFPDVYFGGAGSSIDLNTPVLFAGDSHPSADNYINSLDIAYEINHIYTQDLRADLNRDHIVNSLEFPTLISHLYQTGDN
ncbi:MAG: hypothetical protein WC069_00025 [Candidatus Shapirobacteria bacterium]